jgi:hypothetical protein
MSRAVANAARVGIKASKEKISSFVDEARRGGAALAQVRTQRWLGDSTGGFKGVSLSGCCLVVQGVLADRNIFRHWLQKLLNAGHLAPLLGAA